MFAYFGYSVAGADTKVQLIANTASQGATENLTLLQSSQWQTAAECTGAFNLVKSDCELKAVHKRKKALVRYGPGWPVPGGITVDQSL